MRKKNTLSGRREKLLDRLFAGKRAPKAGFFLLLLLYVIVNMFTMRTAGSAGTVLLMGHQVPLRSLTGAFSSIANLCIIFLVVFYRKPGVIAALTILLVHFPVLLYGLFVRHNYNNIAGFCTNVFTILAVLLLWKNNISIRNYQIRLRDQAATDRLTGLPNRFACSELMEDLIKRGEVFTVAVLRLNNLRRIDNTMGQNAGAAVLGEVVARWRDIMDRHLTGTTDDITCQSEDEFAVIIRDYRSEEDVVKTLSCYETALKDKITVDGCDYYLTASIGYASCPSDANSGDTLLTYAHSALDEVRRNRGGGTMRRFTPELHNAERLIETERKIRSAIDSGALIYYLQPQYDMAHRLIGFEALARIREADGSLMSPGEFIPVAEKLGMIDRIDYTVFKKSAGFLGELIKKNAHEDHPQREHFGALSDEEQLPRRGERHSGELRGPRRSA